MNFAVTLPWSSLLDTVLTFFKNHSAWKFEENLEALKISRGEFEAKMIAVIWKVKNEEGPQMKRLPEVQNWLQTGRDLLQDVDDLLISTDKERDKCCICWFFSKNAEKISRSLQRLTDEQKKGDFQELVGKPPPKSGAEKNVDSTVGTDDMLNEAWNFILDEKPGTLGIYGIGGVGKTTLLKQINNRLLYFPVDFDFVIFITVSQDSREEKIQQEIWDSMGLSSDFLKITPNRRTQAIFEVMMKKTFVLLLDDLWDPIDLEERIGVPSPKQRRRSKVVLTTREQGVCSQMDATARIKVDPLTEEYAWELFKSKVGDEMLAHPDILPLAKSVANECGGLPIALITIGRAMALKNDPEEWESALDYLKQWSTASNSKEMDEVFKRLKFSYDYLPDESTKECFLYCALFPEDFKICKRSLIDNWICEDFFSTREEGNKIVRTLISACLLEEEEDYVKLHDVIRGMALWIAGGKQYLARTGDQRLSELTDLKEWKGKSRISFMSNNITNITGNPTCPDLITLFLCENVDLEEIPEEFFQKMDSLKVLDLSNTAIVKLPADLSQLTLLQYLNLSNTDIEELPIDLKRLVNLKYLNLEGTIYLGMIPRCLISSFSSLRVLKLYKCGSSCREVATDSIWSSIDILEQELRTLKQLRELTITVRDPLILQRSSTSRILQKSFQAIILEQVIGSKPLNIWSLASMEKLQKLTCCSHDLTVHADNSEVEQTESQVRDKRRRHRFQISKALPVYFESLREVTAENCGSLVHLSWVVLLPKLAILKVESCSNMEEIVREESCRESSETFERLEILVLYGLPRLHSIYPKALRLQNLKSISIHRCENLGKLPVSSARAGMCRISTDKSFVYEKEESGN